MQDNTFLKLAGSSKFKLFLFAQIPAAFFSGVRIKNITQELCRVTVPYKWFTKNPFRSTYFACLSMAAELSTGALAMMYVYKHRPSVSMLVVKMEAAYYKKATGITTFTCEDGLQFKKAINEAIQTGESVLLSSDAVGVNENNDVIAKFSITWSFKIKKGK